MTLLIPFLLFAVGLVFLIKGGDWFVDGASGIAHRFAIPEMLIGATVVSIGTTLPEVMVSATSAMQGNGAMAYGNAIGSILCNTALIAALTIAIRPSGVDRKALRFPVCFFFAAMIAYALFAYVFGSFERWMGVVLLLGFVGYMAVLVWQAFVEMKKQGRTVETVDVVEAMVEEVPAEEQGKFGDYLGVLIVGGCLLLAQVITIVASVQADTFPSFFADGFSFADAGEMFLYYGTGLLGLILVALGVLKGVLHRSVAVLNSNFFFLIVGAIVIAIGANLLVENGTIIAETLGVPKTVIALTFVALGTSLPELVTAVTALLKGRSALSLGNIIGANIFNLVLVSGVSITISPFVVPADKLIGSVNASLVIDIPAVFATMSLLTIPALLRGKLSRWQGITLLCIYCGFCIFQFV